MNSATVLVYSIKICQDGSQSDSQAQMCLTGRVSSVGSVPGDSGAALFSLFSFPAAS